MMMVWSFNIDEHPIANGIIDFESRFKFDWFIKLECYGKRSDPLLILLPTIGIIALC